MHVLLTTSFMKKHDNAILEIDLALQDLSVPAVLLKSFGQLRNLI